MSADAPLDGQGSLQLQRPPAQCLRDESMFTPLVLRRITLPHRIVRAATFENMATPEGCATDAHRDLYVSLAEGGVGTIITGFVYTSLEGRAMHVGQAGIDGDDKIEPWRRVVAAVKAHRPQTKLILQISHCGRQTLPSATGRDVVGAGTSRCTYFWSKVRALTTAEVEARVQEYVRAAERAQRAGFDGVEVHAAHGYLVHQFLSPYTNRRDDCYGADRLRFLEEIVRGIKERTGLAIFLKLSAADDQSRGLKLPLILAAIDRLDALGVDAFEISYGMMEIAFNIIRGAHPLEPVLTHNRLFNWLPGFGKAVFRKLVFPLYRLRFKAYNDLYNLENARAIKQVARTPVLVTGGIRTKDQIRLILDHHGLDGVTLSRPFVAEPDFVNRLREAVDYKSLCVNCNLCTVMCDSSRPLRCYRNRAKDQAA